MTSCISAPRNNDYGSGAHGALLRKTLVTYASLPPNITAFRQKVTICNGTGSSSNCAGPSGGSTGTVIAQTNYNDDETTPGSTSGWGITQHTSVSGSRGNLTSINYPVSVSPRTSPTTIQVCRIHRRTSTPPPRPTIMARRPRRTAMGHSLSASASL